MQRQRAAEAEQRKRDRLAEREVAVAVRAAEEAARLAAVQKVQLAEEEERRMRVANGGGSGDRGSTPGESRNTPPHVATHVWQMNPNHPWVGGPPYVNTKTGESRGTPLYSRLSLHAFPFTFTPFPSRLTTKFTSLYSQARHQMGGRTWHIRTRITHGLVGHHM